ncbi:peptidase domain-containing ABC transporter [Sphingomonas sp. PAMC 26605]|uniref:peptidase domain-containing ABC transporter n=1 Tax=Sphingomonas sp. PAMC 26605 TaxID=1112214 RepID=UPI0002DF98B4|nr:peptidase domain-containing ABC transporter [Sphingomonas sp. PAMC 26605]
MIDQLNLGIFSLRRIKHIRQTEIAECGLACLAMISEYYGSNLDLVGLRQDYAPSLKGLSLRNLSNVAENIGLLARPVRVPADSLTRLHLPAILHWDSNHFVVLERIKHGRAEIFDPANGQGSRMTMDEVADHFTGAALELSPTEEFKVFEKRPRLKASQLWKNVTGWKRVATQTLILTIVLQIAAIAWPFYMQIVIDKVLPSSDETLLALVALAFAALTILNGVAVIVRGFVLLSTGTSLGFVVTSRLGKRLFRLPIAWFERRHVGDVMSRFQSVHPIQDAFTQGIVSSLVDGAMALLTLIIMMWYSILLTAITFISFTFYILVRIVSFRLERQAREAAIIAGGREQSMLIETLRGITVLRLFGRENDRHMLWQGRLTDQANANVMVARIGIWQGAANSIITGLEGVLIVWLAANLVLAGGLSIGMLVAYLAYKQQFVSRASTLIDQGIAFRMLSLHLDRISDIALEKEDISFAPPHSADTEFSGQVELKDVFYRYGPAEPWVLRGLNLRVECGQHIAITGSSGGGKSTLAKILLGLDQPESGLMLVDGVPLLQHGVRNYRSKIAAVLQEDCLFAGSIASNIAMFDQEIIMDRVIEAASLAAIAREIDAMPMKYESLVGDMGSALSGGQKARILLARALYRKPRLLLLDEGTAHLDWQTEALVNEAINAMGITRIVIAHRKETIKNADIVYSMNDGLLTMH